MNLTNEMIARAKPILFNTEKVKAILDGRKTATRQLLKSQNRDAIDVVGVEDKSDSSVKLVCEYKDKTTYVLHNYAPYQVGDILYVQETWLPVCLKPIRCIYKADAEHGEDAGLSLKWRYPTCMPKEAARIFLRVTNISAKQLRTMWLDEFAAEGINTSCGIFATVAQFIDSWDGNIRKSVLDKYGWEANPWVWVIEFERLEAK